MHASQELHRTTTKKNKRSHPTKRTVKDDESCRVTGWQAFRLINNGHRLSLSKEQGYTQNKNRRENPGAKRKTFIISFHFFFSVILPPPWPCVYSLDVYSLIPQPFICLVMRINRFFLSAEGRSGIESYMGIHCWKVWGSTPRSYLEFLEGLVISFHPQETDSPLIETVDSCDILIRDLALAKSLFSGWIYTHRRR